MIEDKNTTILRSIEALGYGNTQGQIFFVDDIWPEYLHKKINLNTIGMIDLFVNQYLKRTEIDLNNFYLTCAYKSWMITEDEHHEALKTEIELIRPRVVVSLGRRAQKYLLKVKDNLSSFNWFESIYSYHYVKRFYIEDDFYIKSLNLINKKNNRIYENR